MTAVLKVLGNDNREQESRESEQTTRPRALPHNRSATGGRGRYALGGPRGGDNIAIRLGTIAAAFVGPTTDTAPG